MAFDYIENKADAPELVCARELPTDLQDWCCETCRFADLNPVINGWVIRAGLIDCERKEEFLELGVPTPAFFPADFGCRLWQHKEE